MTTKTEPAPAEVLDTPMRDNDAQANTIREYLVELLLQVWIENEGFSGKRPFGNSGWEWELYAAPFDAGHIAGDRDQDGDLDWVDRDAADELITAAIKSLAQEA
jgi:hypothetical protein